MPTTASDLPPELIPYIISYIGTNNRGDDTYYDDDNRLILCRSSLVCLFWAEHCRKVLHNTVKITSRKSAKRFMDAVVSKRNRVGRLTPLLKLIAHIDVDCELSRDSWIHFLGMPHVAIKLRHLNISGRHLKEDFPRQLLQSPHCGIPPSIPMTPSLTPYCGVSLEDIQFQPFRHALKFLQHFRVAQSIRVIAVDWPKPTHFDTVVILPLRMKRKRPLRRVQALGCTHDAHICVRVASLDPNFAIWKLGSIMASPTLIPQTILDVYDAARAAFGSLSAKHNGCTLKSEGVYRAWAPPTHINNS